MDEPILIVDVDGPIATVTLNRPGAMNAFSRALRRDFVQAFERLRADPGVEVVILTGRGKAFSAGLDVKELGGEAEEAGDPTRGSADIDIAAALEAFDRPVIGAVNGYAITGGLEIALACDIVVCSTAARFADTHARIGVLPGWGMSQRLPRVVGLHRAKEMMLTSNFVTAQRAYEWGLVNRVVAPDELMPTARRLAEDVVSTHREVRERLLGLLDTSWQTHLEAGLEAEQRAAVDYFASRVTPEAVAGRRGGLQARARDQLER